MVGYQEYRSDKPKNHYCEDKHDSKYFTFVSHYEYKTRLAVWGLDLYDPYSKLYIVEGIFDACKPHNMGLNCIAVLGSNPSNLSSWIKTLPNYKIAIGDGDKAGKVLTTYGD